MQPNQIESNNNRNLNEAQRYIWSNIARMEEGMNYYQESCKLYIANIMLTNQVIFWII